MLCTIVGAGPGLAASIAYRFGHEGQKIALLSRSARADVVHSLKAAGIDACAFKVDASKPDDIARAFGDVEEWGGRTDTLVYNAAAMHSDSASTLTAARVLDEMATNLGGAIASVQAVLPGMMACRSGTVLLTGGGLALEPYPTWTSLGSGKAALRAYALALQKEMAPQGVRVCVIAVCGIVEAGGAFDPDLIADVYWRLHNGDAVPRELLYLPAGSDPFYNDPIGAYRDISFPITIPVGAACGTLPTRQPVNTTKQPRPA